MLLLTKVLLGGTKTINKENVKGILHNMSHKGKKFCPYIERRQI